jgi:nucleotide-binding universal stress UspA family protein
MRTFMDRNVSGKFLILVGIDFSENGATVLQSAADIASTTPEAELHLVHAFGPVVTSDRVRCFSALSDLAAIEDSDAAAVALDQLATSNASCAERVCAYVQEGSATAVISQVAEDIDADLVIVGSHDYTGANRAFFGSIAEKLVRQAPCPVLIVRRKASPSVFPLATRCAACEASKRLTWGARVQCLDHAELEAHVNAVAHGSFSVASAPIN